MSLAVRDDPRLAGRVLRFHTWPHIRPQTVAEHSWQVARILMTIWPDCPRHLLVHCIVHDMGEVTTGDLPYPVKTRTPGLQDIMDRLEHESAAQLAADWEMPLPDAPQGSERWAFKLAEFIEMWEFGWEEEILGNRFCRLVAERCLAVAMEMVGQRQIPRVSQLALAYIEKRRQTWRDA